MNKLIFEQMAGTYTMQGDYCLPSLTLPTNEKRPIGVWGQRRLHFLQLVKECAEREGVTEQLKVENPMEWIGRKNNICNRAEEAVNADLIFTVLIIIKYKFSYLNREANQK